MGQSGETVVAADGRILFGSSLEFNMSSIALTQSKAYRRRGGTMIGNGSVAVSRFGRRSLWRLRRASKK